VALVELLTVVLTLALVAVAVAFQPLTCRLLVGARRHRCTERTQCLQLAAQSTLQARPRQPGSSVTQDRAVAAVAQASLAQLARELLVEHAVAAAAAAALPSMGIPAVQAVLGQPGWS
jgi:hypothetical protein